MQRHIINFSNRMNIAGQMATLTGQDTVDSYYKLALIYEPSAQAKLFRIVPLNDKFMEHLTHVRAELTFGLPYHAERLIVLEKIQEEMIKDQDKTPETRILAPMILSAPLYKSDKNEIK